MIMGSMKVFVILATLTCCVMCETEEGDQGLEPVKVFLPDNTSSDSNDKDKRANQNDCYIPSVRAWKRHGETFTLGDNNCITYRCSYGSYSFYQEACRVRSGQCVALNTDFDYSRCSKLRCVKNNLGNYVEYKFVPVGNPKCEVNGVCHEFGQVFEVFCQSKRCISTGNPGGFQIVDAGYTTKCRDSSGRCWSPGQVYSDWLNGRYYNYCVCKGGGSYDCYNYTGKK